MVLVGNDRDDITALDSIAPARRVRAHGLAVNVSAVGRRGGVNRGRVNPTGALVELTLPLLVRPTD